MLVIHAIIDITVSPDGAGAGCRTASVLWNGLIDRWHYLGYSPMLGAQLRYLIHRDHGLLGAIGFGAAAWKWVEDKHLASKVLSLAARRVAEDFPARYSVRVVLLETFVQIPRFRGTCYRAAYWQYLGETTGRGKCDRTHQTLWPERVKVVGRARLAGVRSSLFELKLIEINTRRLRCAIRLLNSSPFREARMGESLSYTLTVKAGSAINRTVSNTVQIQGLDVVEVTIADTSSDQEVEVQPNETNQVKFMLIESSAYDASLTYKTSTSATESFALDSPQAFLGVGALRHLSSTSPPSLFFSNATGADVTVRILVGRDALA